MFFYFDFLLVFLCSLSTESNPIQVENFQIELWIQTYLKIKLLLYLNMPWLQDKYMIWSWPA